MRGLHAMADSARRGQGLRARVALARGLHARGGMRLAWVDWMGRRREVARDAALMATAASAWSSMGRRRAAWRLMAAWRSYADWELRMVRASLRWRWPTMRHAFRALRRIYSLSFAVAHLVGVRAHRRMRASLMEWNAARLSAGLDSSLVVHAAARWAHMMQQWALIEWRENASRSSRRAQEYLRNARTSTLDAAGRACRQRVLRSALHLLRRVSAARIQRSRRALRLGMHIDRIAAGVLLRRWVGFVEWDDDNVAFAAEAFPDLHRRYCLRSWHARASSAVRTIEQCRANLALWRQTRAVAALTAWHARAMRHLSTRRRLAGVRTLWLRGRRVQALRTWHQRCIALSTTLAAVDRAARCWRGHRLTFGWGRWFANKEHRACARVQPTPRAPAAARVRLSS